MLKRIYIDNYKCCVNLEVKFDALNLLLGDNGVGKSTVFQVLHKIQALAAEGREIAELFSTDTLTRWQTINRQHFELEIHGNGGTYRYQLIIVHNHSDSLPQIVTEKLWFDGQPLIHFSDGNVQLFRDDYAEGPNFPFDSNRSALSSIPARINNTKLTWFRNRLRRVVVIRINPISAKSHSEKESDFLDAQGRNFASWYRFVSQNQGKAFEITHTLQEVIDGFKYFEFEQTGETQRTLKARINQYGYRFDEISDGQRALIILYTLIHFAQGQNYTLCIDEPENFISLPELQPWLSQLYDFTTDGALQALLVSHHPEFINYLAGSAGILFERADNGPVRINPLPSDSGLLFSELMARGWINEPA